VRAKYDIQCSSRNRRRALVAQRCGVCNGATLEFRAETLLGGDYFVRCGTDNRIFGNDAISHRCFRVRKRSVTVAVRFARVFHCDAGFRRIHAGKHALEKNQICISCLTSVR